ncbi:MAG: hypothetical protein HY672_01195 [Chloroflexi bacterium]|nr:hypothetical protein [Chloroflexota bacterium]
MITESIAAEALLECQNKRKVIQEANKILTEWDASLAQEESALRTLVQVSREDDSFVKRSREAQLSLPGMGVPAKVPTAKSVQRRRRKDGKKPDVQIIEEIFREHGPLHVSDLVPIGQTRGVSFKGKKKPTLMARDKMVSSKRFRLFGNNVWGLPHQELPEHRNGKGHDAESPIHVG